MSACPLVSPAALRGLPDVHRGVQAEERHAARGAVAAGAGPRGRRIPGGEAGVLDKDYLNPASMKNVLVGHLVAVTLAVGFDNWDANFGSGGQHLGDMYIGSGLFKGKTVSEFLAIANNVLGGCSNAYTAKQVLETATAINENYVDGKVNLGYLVCEPVQ